MRGHQLRWHAHDGRFDGFPPARFRDIEILGEFIHYQQGPESVHAGGQLLEGGTRSRVRPILHWTGHDQEVGARDQAAQQRGILHGQFGALRHQQGQAAQIGLAGQTQAHRLEPVAGAGVGNPIRSGQSFQKGVQPVEGLPFAVTVLQHVLAITELDLDQTELVDHVTEYRSP